LRNTQVADARRVTAFSVYLRTGRRGISGNLEVKFNPWHDPADGRFTFAGRGVRSAGGDRGTAGAGDTQDASSRLAQDRAKYADPTYTDAEASARDNDPKNPRNYSIYTVRRGDTFTRIAGYRKGITAADLAWLNDVPLDQALQIGQRLKVPHQQYLDAGREAKNKLLANAYYTQTHNGRFPPDVANPPSVESQILDTNWNHVTKGGYEFYIDAIGRTRQVFGLAHFGDSKRSRKNQTGVEDRSPEDDGGHYIALRFEGPSEAFNHFAQNANFNRGRYRALEDRWAKEIRAGHKVFVNIVPHYEGTSKRPDRLSITWSVNGQKHKVKFENAGTGQANGTG
jgi:LysM repeat protein